MADGDQDKDDRECARHGGEDGGEGIFTGVAGEPVDEYLTEDDGQRDHEGCSDLVNCIDLLA